MPQQINKTEISKVKLEDKHLGLTCWIEAANPEFEDFMVQWSALEKKPISIFTKTVTLSTTIEIPREGFPSSGTYDLRWGPVLNKPHKPLQFKVISTDPAGEECLEAETWAQKLTQSFSAREWRKNKDRELFRPHSISTVPNNMGSIRIEVRIVEVQRQRSGIFTLGTEPEDAWLVFELKFVYKDSDPIASSLRRGNRKRKRAAELSQSPESNERPAHTSRKRLTQTCRVSVADTESENEFDGTNVKLEGEPEHLDGLVGGLDQQPPSRQSAGPSSTAGTAHGTSHQVVGSTPRNRPFPSVPTPGPSDREHSELAPGLVATTSQLSRQPSTDVAKHDSTNHAVASSSSTAGHEAVSGPSVDKPPTARELEERLRQLKDRSKALDAEFAEKEEDRRRKLEIEVAKYEQEVKEKEQRNKSMEEF
ncbi:hypothetical protein BT96DRAFT_1001275 [Gymnopus androsaceus JB14]|uniref:Uncharacterized protein n=1 Tax=Gymnopus androsaceus JB14 TaxID=1447944 RepID=A0A6A4H2B6_9AGAR|nr:hypothetical protein BT96DRAFT_1001275 [Gymnopus androsaceus JB14]